MIAGIDRSAVRETVHRLMQAGEDARENFLVMVQESAGVNRADAEKIMGVYRKERLIKLDRTNRRYTVRHGAFWDRPVLLRALRVANGEDLS